jgi:hypothetical protein
MLADPKAHALVENFAGQWLETRRLESVRPDRERYPDFDDYLRTSIMKETELFFQYVMRSDRSILDFIDGNYTFLNERLAKHYGIPDVRGSYFRKVGLTAESHRRGLLGQGSILTITSTASRTSPVIRGSWILDNLLGAPVPAPPPGVDTNIDGDGSHVITTSVRQRLELHRKNPSCASCHNVMDPVGFALENYNAIGAWRDRDGDALIDASGTLIDGTRVVGPTDLTAAILSNPELFVTHFTEKLMIYALGRALEPRDIFLLVNMNVPASQEIADHYCAKRGVPKEKFAELRGYRAIALELDRAFAEPVAVTKQRTMPFGIEWALALVAR